MPVQSQIAFPASEPASFEIKSAQLTLLALLVKSADLAKISADLLAKFGPNGESPEFFDTDGIVLDFSQSEIALPHPQWNLLLNTLAQCRLSASAVRGLDAESLLFAKKWLARSAFRNPSPGQQNCRTCATNACSSQSFATHGRKASCACCRAGSANRDHGGP